MYSDTCSFFLVRKCCDDSDLIPRKSICKDMCDSCDNGDDDDDDDDAKCSMGGNQDFLDDIVGCLESEMKTSSGLSCNECK